MVSEEIVERTWREVAVIAPKLAQSQMMRDVHLTEEESGELFLCLKTVVDCLHAAATP